MKKENTKNKLTMLASGAAIIGTIAGNTVQATELFNYEDLGTGSELRSNLLTADALNSFTSNTEFEFECGEGKCGEGKCGEKSDKKDGKSEGDVKKSDANTVKPAVKSESAKGTEQKSEKATAPAKKKSKTKSEGAETPKN